MAKVRWVALRAPRGQMQGAATIQMRDIGEERQRRRWPRAAATRREHGVYAFYAAKVEQQASSRELTPEVDSSSVNPVFAARRTFATDC